MWHQEQGDRRVPEGTPSSADLLPCKWSNCSLLFASGEELFKHICDEHTTTYAPLPPAQGTKQKPVYLCQWERCGVAVNKRDHLVSHVRVHVDIWPYACSTCSRNFRRPQDLKKHFATSLHEQMVEKEKIKEQRSSETSSRTPPKSPLPSQPSCPPEVPSKRPSMSSLEVPLEIALENSISIEGPPQHYLDTTNKAFRADLTDDPESAKMFEDQYVEFYKQYQPQEPSYQSQYYRLADPIDSIYDGGPPKYSHGIIQSASSSNMNVSIDTWDNQDIDPQVHLIAKPLSDVGSSDFLPVHQRIWEYPADRLVSWDQGTESECEEPVPKKRVCKNMTSDETTKFA